VFGDGGRPAQRLSRRALYLLLGGWAIREALSFWTGHPYDLESFLRTGYVVAHGGSPYLGPVGAVPGVSFAYLTDRIALASYPPFWPELLGGVYALWERVGGGDRFLLYFLLKQPGIVGDVLCAYLLGRVAVREGCSSRQADSLVGFWAYFPYAITITAVWGQFDSLVVAIVLLALLTRETVARNLGYGLGVLAKWITVVFLPLEFFRARGWRRLLVPGTLLVAAGLGSLPFLLQGWSFPGFSNVAVYEAHGNNLGMNYVYALTFGPGSGPLERVPYLYAALGFLWAPAAMFAGWFGARWVRAGARGSDLRAVLLVVSAVLTVRWGLYEQYFLYLFALLVLDLALFHPGRRALFWFTTALASAQLLVNNDLGLRFLTPVWPALLGALVHGEAAGGWAAPREYALLVLSIAMTATLVQIVWVVVRDEKAPTPWLLRLVRWDPKRTRLT